MSNNSKPLPVITSWSRPFWDACKRQELIIQQCEECGAKIFYPKLFCPYCQSSELKWVKASGTGKIYTFTTIYSHQPEAFKEDTPYVVAVVRLDEGVQMMANVVGCKPEDIKCDMRVQVTFKPVNIDITLPRFTPIP